MYKGIVIEFLVKKYVIVDLKTKEKKYAQVKGKIQNYISKTHVNDVSVSDYSKIKIGDIVLYEQKDDKFLIDSIIPRRNELQRPNVANINQVLLVFSLVQPPFDFKLLDKFLLILNKCRLKVILVFTKIDLIKLPELSFFQKQIAYYEKFYDVYYVDSKHKQGLELLYSVFKNKVTILAGQTGVGKSTLLNALTSLNLKTQAISKSLNRGKHTTKNSKLFFFHEGYIADTPGFSKMDLSDILAEEIKDFYNDFLIFVDQCFFGYSCLHIKESQCGVKTAYQQGLISTIRYNNYLSLFQEIKNKKISRNKK